MAIEAFENWLVSHASNLIFHSGFLFLLIFLGDKCFIIAAFKKKSTCFIFEFPHFLTFLILPPDAKRSRRKETTRRNANPNNTVRKSTSTLEPSKQNCSVSQIRITIKKTHLRECDTEVLKIFVSFTFSLQFSILI